MDIHTYYVKINKSIRILYLRMYLLADYCLTLYEQSLVIHS